MSEIDGLIWEHSPNGVEHTVAPAIWDKIQYDYNHEESSDTGSSKLNILEEEL
jgi:hypothetical protein